MCTRRGCSAGAPASYAGNAAPRPSPRRPWPSTSRRRPRTAPRHDALQIHGANGCGPDTPVERWFRDARIMEIIEGSSQVLEIAIARYAYQERS